MEDGTNGKNAVLGLPVRMLLHIKQVTCSRVLRTGFGYWLDRDHGYKGGYSSLPADKCVVASKSALYFSGGTTK